MKKKKNLETDITLPFPFEADLLASLNNNETSARKAPTILPADNCPQESAFADDPRRTASGAYRQNWTPYNTAKANEFDHFQKMLWHLCQIPEEAEQMRGQPRLAFSDMLFIAVSQAYFQKFSARVFKSFVKRMEQDGFVTKVPHWNSIHNFLKLPDTVAALKQMLAVSSLPFVPLERHFAADSSGFATYTFSEYRKKKYGDSGKKRLWRQAHIICGVGSKVVTAIELTEGTANDTNYLEPLLRQTGERFQIEEVSADKGYLSDDNFRLIESVGAEAFIKFKENAKGRNKHLEYYNRAFHRFSYDREKYLSRYHRRSNVESVFSMVKRNYGEKLRSKNQISQDNEIIAKFVCHNLSCLILTMYELGVEPTEIFDGDKIPAAPITVSGTH